MFQPTATITTHHVSLCRTGHNRLDEDRRQARVYPRQRLSRLPSDRHDRHTRVITITTYQIPIARNNYYAFMNMIIAPQKIPNTSRHGGVITVSNNPQKLLCQGSECLPSKVCKRGAHLKVDSFFKT